MPIAPAVTTPWFRTRRAGAASTLLAFGVAAAATAAFFPSAASMIEQWMRSSSYQHGVLVAPIALFLIVRSGLAAAPHASFPFLIPLACASAAWLAGRAAGADVVEHAALVLALASGAGLVFGGANARRWAFALAFLVFMVPFGDALVPHLQSVTAKAAAFLLDRIGVPAALDGEMITTAGGRFAVAEACAGLNFLLAALMIAALFAHLSFRTAKKQLLFVGSAVAVAILANILRAFLVILTATLTEGRLAIGADHIAFGLVFYGLLVFALVAVGLRFADPPRAATAIWSQAPRKSTFVALLGGTAVLMAASAYANFVLDRAQGATPPAQLAAFAAPGWRIVPQTGAWRAALPGAEPSLAVVYRSDAGEIFVNAGYFAREARGAEAGSSAVRTHDGDAYRRIASARHSLEVFGAPLALYVDRLEGAAGDSLHALIVYIIDGEATSSRRKVKLRQMQARLGGKNLPVAVVAVAARDPAELRAYLADAETAAQWQARISAAAPR